MDFIKNMYEEGLVEKQLDEDAWADIRKRRVERLRDERNVALYGYLVGPEKAMRAKRFIEMAEEGKSIPKNFVEAYFPIIAMIDDIVDAGPGAVAQLRNLHKRHKK
jgi:hypothetical protein